MDDKNLFQPGKDNYFEKGFIPTPPPAQPVQVEPLVGHNPTSIPPAQTGTPATPTENGE